MGYKKQQSGIYCIILSNKIVYIGQTKKNRTRWYAHRKALESNSHVNTHLQNKYNKDLNLGFRMLEISGEDNLSPLEKKWVDYYGFETLCNFQYPDINQAYIVSKETIAKIVKAHTGRRNTPGTIEKMGLAQLGEKNHMYGKKQSVESNKKRSESLRKFYATNTPVNKGRKLTESQKTNISKGIKKYYQDPENRRKKSLESIGRKRSKETQEKMLKILYKPINEDLFDQLIEMGVMKKDIEQIFGFSNVKYYSELKRHKERKNEQEKI